MPTRENEVSLAGETECILKEVNEERLADRQFSLGAERHIQLLGAGQRSTGLWPWNNLERGHSTLRSLGPSLKVLPGSSHSFYYGNVKGSVGKSWTVLPSMYKTDLHI